MSAAQILGAMLVSLPFLDVLALVQREIGWGGVLLLVLIVSAVGACVVTGAFLLSGELS